MGLKIRELLGLNRWTIHKSAGYILFVSIAVLLLVSSVIVYQYHYYHDYHQLENELYQNYVAQIKTNLK